MGTLFFLAFTYAAVYLVVLAGLSPLQLVLVGTVLEFTVLVGEVPTGIVADLRGRKRSIVIGLLLVGAGFVLEASIPRFGPILVSQVVWGFGFTFTSGADAAWITDEVGEDAAAELFLRGAQLRQVGALVGIAVGAILAPVALWAPLMAAGFGFMALAVFTIFAIHEPSFQPTKGTAGPWPPLRILGDGLAEVRRLPALRWLTAAAVIYWLTSEAVDRLWEMHILTAFALPPVGNLAPVTWFAVINAAALALSIAATEWVRRWAPLDRPRRAAYLLGAIQVALVGALFSFAGAPGFAAGVAAYLVVYFLRQLHDPVMLGVVNRGLRRERRATVLSMYSQAGALGQVVGGPFFGTLASIRSIPTAIAASAAVLLAAPFLLGPAGRALSDRSETPSPPET